MTMLDVATKCISRGWWVFPCEVQGKAPLIKRGFHAASNVPEQIEAWWTKWPDANVGIATGASGLTVLDIDAGLENTLGVALLRAAKGLPETYTVRTGRRPGFGVQMYFKGGDLKSIGWAEDELHGDIRSATGYVLAEGCTHPSGEKYERLVEAPIADTGHWVRSLKAVAYAGNTGGSNPAVKDDGGPITEGRNNALTSILGRYRAEGHTDEEVEAFAHEVNETRCQPPLGESELDRLIQNACKWEIGEPEIEVKLGGKIVETSALAPPPAPPVDWRSLFHTREETENTPDPEFLIRDFLQTESVTGIIGPARARKSIVSLNIIRALLTGEPLFGHFEVSNRPKRVVYLCPESGKSSLAKRIRNLGIARYVGDSFFYSSMNSDPMKLTDGPLREATDGAVVFIDTAIRFFEGNENDAGDMKILGSQCQALIRDGARAVVLLHHTAKNTEKVTLESGRGSGDFGGFLTCCWGTTLDDYDDAYRAQSLMTCVKQRDFQAEKFKLAASGDPDNFVLRYVEADDGVVVSAKAEGNKRKAEEADKVSKELYEADPDISVNALRLALKTRKFGKGTEWCRAKLTELKETGVTLA